MEAHFEEWLNLLIRWIHFIVGTAWIGASFYFNWLENHLERRIPDDEGILGTLWAVHGGGFYQLQKYSPGPKTLPSPLHWFKWEAYATWLSGIALLIIIYYFHAGIWLIDPDVRELAPWQGITIGVSAMVLSWLFYHRLCLTLRNQQVLLVALIFGWFCLLAFGLSQLLSSRAAYIHVGAAIGTVMVANVFFVIIPSQKELVRALADNRPMNPEYGRNGLLRSRHNNYFTLPVLFTMISGHFPGTYGSTWNWLVLIALAVIGITVRHYFNVRHLRSQAIWILPVALIAMLGLVWLTKPDPEQSEGPLLRETAAFNLITTHCAGCHARTPTYPGFSSAPKDIRLDTLDEFHRHLEAINRVTVLTRTMPLGNLTGMSDEERLALGQWIMHRKSSHE